MCLESFYPRALVPYSLRPLLLRSILFGMRKQLFVVCLMQYISIDWGLSWPDLLYIFQNQNALSGVFPEKLPIVQLLKNNSLFIGHEGSLFQNSLAVSETYPEENESTGDLQFTFL